MNCISLILAYPYAITMLVVTVLAVVLAVYVWQRRSAPGATVFILLMVCAAEWSLMNCLEMTLPGLQTKVLATQLSYLSVVFIGPLWLLFTLEYSHRNAWITPGKTALLCIIPVVTIAFVMTNGCHGLVWPQITLESDIPGAIPVYQHGVIYWIHTIYSYTLLLLGFGVLAATAIRASGWQRLKILGILAGVAFIWAGSMPYVINVKPLTDFDLTPLAMTATGFLLAWLIFSNRLFNILPIARETLITNMCDGVIVIDDRGIIAEMNPAARKLIGAENKSGEKPADEVLGHWPDLCNHCHRGTIGTPSEIRVDSPEGSRWLDVRISLLPIDGEKRAGRLIVMRDITELKRSHESLQAEMIERKRAEERIKLSLQEKEVLLKEIHHRVKNNLQIISSLLNLQSSNLNKEAAAAFKESQNRIKSMALIHEKLYQSSDLSRVDFGEYVGCLTTHLVRSYTSNPGVSVSMDIRGISLDIDTAIPCGLIINELVSNSLKYAFPDGRTGIIHIDMALDNGAYRLTVGDNGIGLSQGTNYRNTGSLGLQLVDTLVDQLEGTIELVPEKGATFMITFKENTKN